MPPLLPLLALACAPTPHDSGLTALLVRLDAHCGGAAVTAIAAGPEGLGWVACGADLKNTRDAGRSFSPDPPAPAVRINRLLIEPDGALLACGWEPGGDGLLWRRTRVGGWGQLLRAGEAGGLGACAQVARLPGGDLAVSGAAAPGLALQGRDGAWHLPAGWAEGAEPPWLYDLAGGPAGWVALAAGLTGPPAFLASASRIAPLPLLAAVPDPGLAGELWALATPDGGTTWLVGGRDLGDDGYPVAVLLRSTDAGTSWSRRHLPVGLGWVRALAFASDSPCGVAVGQRLARAEGGFVLVSCDAGATWVEVPATTPNLRAAAALDDGFLVAGEGGYVGRGWWP